MYDNFFIVKKNEDPYKLLCALEKQLLGIEITLLHTFNNKAVAQLLKRKKNLQVRIKALNGSLKLNNKLK
jgi:hypothetical protein